MNNLKELYQQVILDHNKNPHHFEKIQNYTHHLEGYNPLCGDHYHLYLQIHNNQITNIGFTGEGCAISKSSASIMTDLMINQMTDKANVIIKEFTHMLREDPPYKEDLLNKAIVLSGVKQFPLRIKCANLAWYTLKSLLDGGNKITTE